MSLLHSNLSIKATTMACGLVNSVVLALLALFAMLGYGQELVVILSGLFSGYEASGPGLLLGAVWGFLVGAVFGALYSWIYNSVS